MLESDVCWLDPEQAPFFLYSWEMELVFRCVLTTAPLSNVAVDHAVGIWRARQGGNLDRDFPECRTRIVGRNGSQDDVLVLA